MLNRGVVPLSRAWLLGPTTKAGPERRGGYGTTDPLEEVLAPNYFALGSALLRPGELIYVSVAPHQAGGPEPAEPHLALVMVRADARSPERADGSVRLVRDFGRPGDPAGTLGLPRSTAAGAPGVSAAVAPVKRPRPPARQPHQETCHDSDWRFPETATAGQTWPSIPLGPLSRFIPLI